MVLSEVTLFSSGILPLIVFPGLESYIILSLILASMNNITIIALSIVSDICLFFSDKDEMKFRSSIFIKLLGLIFADP